MLRFLLGPEVFWFILYAAAALLGRLNQPPSTGLNDFVERIWFWLPAAGLLVFGLWCLPTVEKNWLLLRVWICGIFGWHFVLEQVFSDFNKSGPGGGTAYLVSFILQLIFLVAGSVFVKIKF